MQGKRALDFDYLKEISMTDFDGIEKMPLNDFVSKSWINDKLDELWVKNYKSNKLQINPAVYIYDDYGKVCILIGSSPAVKKQINTLKRIQNDKNFILIACNGIFKYLLHNGIVPDYVFVVEGRPHVVDDLDVFSPSTTLITSPFVDPQIIKKWSGKHFTYMLGGGEKYNSEFKKDCPEPDIGGGNVISTAMLWAYKFLKCRDFIFTGLSLCYYDDYYFDGRSTEHIGAINQEQEGLYQAVDIYGNIVNTTPALTMYKTWLETYSRYMESRIINSTEDGILGVYPEPVKRIDDDTIQMAAKYIPWITIIPLKTAIEGYKLKFKE